MKRRGRGKAITLRNPPEWKAAEKWWGLDSDRFRDGQQPYRSLAHRHYRSAFGGVEPPEAPDQREA